MKFAERSSSTRLRAVFQRGSVIRAAVVCLFVASTGMIVSAVTPSVAAASQTDWSAPQNVDGSNQLISVSCATPLFCAAVDLQGNVLTFNGSSWSAPDMISEGDLFSVSCPSASFCVAVGAGGAENTWDGSTWSGPGPVGTDTSDLLSVSCTNSQFCVAVDDNGGVDTLNGSSWTGPTAIDPGVQLDSVSCTSQTFCVAIDHEGNAFTYGGEDWSSADNIDGSTVLNRVSCTSASYCVAVDEDGNALTYDGSSWTSLSIDAVSVFSVSCPTTSFCVAVDANGNAITYDGSSWSSNDIDGELTLYSVNCPTTSFCAAVDQAGNALTYGWVSASYTCAFPGLGNTTTPVLLSEAPSPPASITAPGTFQTTLSSEVTIPSAAIDNALTQGASSITIGSQSVETDGLTPSDTPSTSVDPNTLSSSATNLPITFTPETNTPYTYPTTYNPETWQTVNVPGTVDFTPGDIDFNLTYVIDNVPTAESVSCTPPVGVTDLDTTNVLASGASPTFQTPPSVPPLQSQVTAPLDAGWGIQITNTSTVDVNGLSAAVTVNGGSGTLTYDLAGMSNTGTTCTSSGPNKATCTVGTLAEGATRTLNVLVQTTGLAQGTSITGSVDVTASNASEQSSSLGAIDVVVVQNGVVAVAVPAVGVKSALGPLTNSKPAKVRLDLPADVPANGLFGAETKIQGPPVSVTLVPLAGSQDPEMCPPSTGGCEGDIMEVNGNFAPYTSTADPIVVVIKVFYGSSVPAGSVYFQDSASATPVLLPKCVLTGVNYNTPCRHGAEKIIGTAGNLYTSDMILFTGNDPLVGRR